MKEIKLTRGQYAMVDDKDFEWLNQWKWHATKTKYQFYARRTTTLAGKHIAQSMHRLILDAKKGEEVDHMNRNSLDNRRENIKICTRSENNRNRQVFGGSKHRGVCWNKGSKKWASYLITEDEKFYLGLFKEEKDASDAFNKKYKEIHGMMPPKN